MRIYSGCSIPFHWSIYLHLCQHHRDFPGGSDGKASASNVGDLGLIPGWGRSPGEGNGTLEKEMAPWRRNGTLAWKIPWTKEPGRLQSMESQNRTRLSDFTHTHTHVPVPHYCNSLIFVVSFEIRKCEFSTLVFHFQDCFEYLELPESLYGF